MVYSDVLQEAFRRTGAALGFEVTNAEAAALGSSVGDWLAFPDSAEALARLKQHYRLIILSNVHREGFAASKKDAELPISRTLRTRGTRQKVGTQIACARTSTCRVVVIAPDRRFRAPPCGRYGTAARSRSSGARGRGWPCGPAGELRLEGRGLTPPPTRHAGVLDDLRAGPGVRQSQTSAPLQVGEQG
jgi:hypothetical protein